MKHSGVTRQERTAWRDEWISARHRQWGMELPAVDIDFLMIEFSWSVPYALVEYKEMSAIYGYRRTPSINAICYLANGYTNPLPMMVVFYAPLTATFIVKPENPAAVAIYGADPVKLSEDEYVDSLYKIRGITR